MAAATAINAAPPTSTLARDALETLARLKAQLEDTLVPLHAQSKKPASMRATTHEGTQETPRERAASPRRGRRGSGCFERVVPTRLKQWVHWYAAQEWLPAMRVEDGVLLTPEEARSGPGSGVFALLCALDALADPPSGEVTAHVEAAVATPPCAPCATNTACTPSAPVQLRQRAGDATLLFVRAHLPAACAGARTSATATTRTPLLFSIPLTAATPFPGRVGDGAALLAGADPTTILRASLAFRVPTLPADAAVIDVSAGTEWLVPAALSTCT